MCFDYAESMMKNTPWPFVAVVTGICLALSAPSVVGTIESSKVKKEIIQACAHNPDVTVCSNELKNALNDLDR